MADIEVQANVDTQGADTQQQQNPDVAQQQQPNTDPANQQQQAQTNPNADTTGAGDNKQGDRDKQKDADTQQQQSPDAGLDNKIDTQNKADNDAKKTLADKNIDFDKLADEYAQNGNTLTEETYKKLGDAGYPKTVVDAYIAGKQALVSQFSDAIIRHAGGEKEYERLTNAIKAKGTEAVNAYNSLIEAGNVSAIKMVLDGVKGDTQARLGTNNPTLLGSASNTGTTGYNSVSDMQTAMDDKRYGRDEAYTLEVQDKVAKSKFIKYGNN